jgi:DNA-binding transcriptional LysR family regulator
MTVDPFIEMELLCALPRGHRLAARSEITPKLLSNEPFIFLRYTPYVERKIEDAFTREKCAPKIVAEVGLSEAACAFVSNGLGISLVDPFGVIAHSSTKLEIRRFQPRIVVDTWLFRPTYRPRHYYLMLF